MDTAAVMRWAITGLAAIAMASPATAEGDAAHGLKLAEQHCARCHVISPDSPRRGLDNAPSFPLLIRTRPDFRERFATFYTRRPHPAYVTVKEDVQRMPHLPATAEPIELEADAIADLVAYATKLRSEM